ncbi:hypothetical protein [Amycolatopsis magusensis]|uniref:hypothetical protein n=1 Tax=Amycolatopsis magusensis TaxID=882444 RepID=UPI0024A9A624|nr:hypothetical protein [Amycolatopsis magusensis]MDI5978242.1 hypothetical protein [Amycolatopsis magusensis]
MNPVMLTSDPANDSGKPPGNQRHTERDAPLKRAERLVSGLHRTLAGLNPVDYVWKVPGGLRYEPEDLRRAWDPKVTTLQSEDLYRAVLEMVPGSARVEEQFWRTYASASYLVETTKVEQPAQPPDETQMWISIAGGQHQSTMPEIELIHTESGFQRHLRTLKDRSGLGLRRIGTEITEVDPQLGRAPSTLSTLFQRDEIALGEKLMRALLVVLLRKIDDDPHVVANLVERLMRVWRALIARRDQPHDLFDPVHALLAKLSDAEEHAAGTASNVRQVPGLQTAQRIVTQVLRELNQELLRSCPEEDTSADGHAAPAA